MNKLKVINDNNQIDLLSLSNFLLRKKDDYLEALLKINGYKKLIIDYNSDFFFDRILPYGESKYFNITIIPDQYWYNYDFCMRAISSNGGGYLLTYVPKELRDYKLCELAVVSNGYALKYVPKELRDYKLCELAVLSNGYNLQYVPKDIINYYALLKISFKQYGSVLVSNEWFPEEYIPQLIKDYPEYKESLESYLLQEYVKKEVKKLLREYYLKEK